MQLHELTVSQQDGPHVLGRRPSHGDHHAEAHGNRLRRLRAGCFASEFEGAQRPIGEIL